MKSISILIVFYIVFLANFASAQKSAIIVVNGDTVNLAKDTLVRNKLIHLNLQQFEGKTVAELLKNDTVKLYKRYFFSDEPRLILRNLHLTFARGLYLTIGFAELKYQSRFSKTREYSFEKILNETISLIELDKRDFEENVVKKYSKSN